MNGKKTIYVVDDDEAVRDSLRVLLQIDGYAVQTFDTCLTFLGNFRQTRDACLILDLHLPGTDGWELVDILNEQKIDIPVILITGSYGPSYRERLTESNALTLLEKPLDRDLLLKAINAAFD